jgi:hypothetical protein
MPPSPPTTALTPGIGGRPPKPKALTPGLGGPPSNAQALTPGLRETYPFEQPRALWQEPPRLVKQNASRDLLAKQNASRELLATHAAIAARLKALKRLPCEDMKERPLKTRKMRKSPMVAEQLRIKKDRAAEEAAGYETPSDDDDEKNPRKCPKAPTRFDGFPTLKAQIDYRTNVDGMSTDMRNKAYKALTNEKDKCEKDLKENEFDMREFNESFGTTGLSEKQFIVQDALERIQGRLEQSLQTIEAKMTVIATRA